MRWLLLVGLVVPSLAFVFYSPKVARWTTPDPIEDAGGKNLYAFCENDPVNKFDPNGCAYFAYRMLDSDFARRFGIIRMGLENFNWAVAHEQLIFEDGGDPINIGYFDDSMRKRDQFNLQNQYEPSPGHYDDCVMREAVKNVVPRPYKLLWNNCQDYADALRAEYFRLLADREIWCKCGIGEMEKK